MIQSDTEEEDLYNQQHGEIQKHSQSDERSRNRQPRFRRSFRVTHLWTPSPINKEEDSDTDDEYLGHMVNCDNSSTSEALTSVTGFHVVRVVLRLLQSLGELDMGPHGYLRGRALSATILPHLLYFFSQFKQPGLKAAELNSITKTEQWLDSHHYQSSKETSSKNAEDQHPHEFPSNDKNGVAGFSSDRRGSPEVNTAYQKSDTEEEVESVPWHGTCKMLVLRQLVRAILALSGIVATQQNGVRILTNLKVMDTLLDL